MSLLTALPWECADWTAVEIAALGSLLWFCPIRVSSPLNRAKTGKRLSWSLTVLLSMTGLRACMYEREPPQPDWFPDCLPGSALCADPFFLLTPESEQIMTDSVTKAELIEANTALTEKVTLLEEKANLLESELAARKSGGDALMSDDLQARIGVLFPAAERATRMLGRDEQVMLAAVTMAGMQALAEDEGKDASADFIVKFVDRVLQPYRAGNGNPQPLTGNDSK